jgi:hypothetical protein
MCPSGPFTDSWSQWSKIEGELEPRLPVERLPKDAVSGIHAWLRRLSLDEHQRHVVTLLYRSTETDDICDQALHYERWL